MAKFIEVHIGGDPRSINLFWVQDIWKDGEKADIYFACHGPNAADYERIRPDESYEEVRRMIRAAGGL